MPLPPLIPREVLFGNPERASPQISPDGSMMTYLAPVDGVLNVWAGSTGGGDYRPITHDRDRGIRTYFWGHDGGHVLYLQDAGGDENWRLYAVDVTSGATRELTPFENVQVQVVGHDKHFPHEILIGMNRDDPRLHDVYHVDLRSGVLTIAAKNPGNVIGWLMDHALQVRAAMAARPDGGFDLLVRERAQSDWRDLISWSADDSLNSAPLGFSADGKSLYLEDSREANSARLVQLEIATGKTQVIAADPEYDVDAIMEHPDTHEIQMVAFIRERREWTVLDPSIRADVDAVRKLHQGDFAIYDRTHADDVWLAGFDLDTGPAAYYAFDRPTRAGRFLFFNRPALSGYTLAPMEPIRFAARDGLTVHGYATFPPGAGRRSLPTVLNVHGGPWARDMWGYDPEAQWLANRGYLCLQVNYRGSTGYGKRFLNAGDREWGGKMHDDLVDAVRWATAQRFADPARVAIYGGSYGGYAALVGAAFTPELFRCAVDIVGPSNLLTFIDTIPPYWSAYLSMMHRRVGHPEKDRELLLSRSPLNAVERIRIPLLIAQGANDPRVKQSESEQIVAALKAKRIDHEYLLFPDEGHGFAKPENRLTFYRAAERFLARHLGGRNEE
ncbi:MAG: S9 family peptidase [Gemmatimonadetes bacterium]|nr:S9 family peptidase [Gemmatimonadota bacterium]